LQTKPSAAKSDKVTSNSRYKSSEFIQERRNFWQNLQKSILRADWAFEEFWSKYECKMCGTCCRENWIMPLIATWNDIERWKNQNRLDILNYVYVFEKLGGDLWVNMETLEELNSCPFLLKQDNKHYKCEINQTKPTVCRVFPLTIWNETNCPHCSSPIEETDFYCPNCKVPTRIHPWSLKYCKATKNALKLLKKLYKK
jgi:Fe-S-cluster containining protein